MEERLKNMVDKAITGIKDFVFDVTDNDGKLELSYSFYADYRDRFEDSDVADALDSDDPEEWLYRCLEDCYFDYSRDLLMQAADDIEMYIEDHSEDELDAEEKSELLDYLDDITRFDYDEAMGHYLNEEYKCDIKIDVNDMDFHYNDGECDYDLSSVLWLAEQQGYSREELERMLNDPEYKTESRFMKSLHEELMNTTSQYNTLTVLVRFSLADLLYVNQLGKEGKGEITIGRGATIGLVDFVFGGGSVLNIELEKDLVIPVRYIEECIPDDSLRKRGAIDCSVDGIYGLCGNAWESEYKNLV